MRGVPAPRRLCSRRTPCVVPPSVAWSFVCDVSDDVSRRYILERGCAMAVGSGDSAQTVGDSLLKYPVKEYPVEEYPMEHAECCRVLWTAGRACKLSSLRSKL